MNIFQVWLALPLQRRIVSALSVLATIAALYGLVSVSLKPKLDLLYAGLDPAAAGEIIAKLEGKEVAYEVRGNAIYADVKRRDALRLELARDGLPRQSVVGYELFDDMNSFAMTSEMFNTAYWRAKEGELARTLLTMPGVQSARVHLGTQKSSGFNNGNTAQTASVTLSSSGRLSLQQAKAIQYLTALSVSGLDPADVAVIDINKGVIAGPGLEDERTQGGSGELERAAQIKQSLLSMLEARVGTGNARVTVSLDVDRTRETTAQHTYDPESRVLKSQTTNEVTDSSSGTEGNVTVASNLPEGAAGGGNRTADRSETSETVTYEISELVRNTEKLPGAITRMTVAVLINDRIVTVGEDETTVTSRTPEELEALRELAAVAAGLNEERGDQLTIKSLPFDQPVIEDGYERPSLFQQFLETYLWNIVQSAILGLVVLLLGLFVVRPLLKPNEDTQQGLLPMTLAGGLDANGNVLPGAMGLTDEGEAVPRLENASAEADAPDPLEMLRDLTSEQPDEAARLLASWLENDPQQVAS